MSLPDMKTVESSNIDKIGYNKIEQNLYISFLRSGLYIYINVPESEFNSLMQSSSKGKYFSINIKRKYQYKKI